MSEILKTKIEFVLNLIILLVGLLVMVAWWLDLDFLLTILPESASMKFNTATLFVFAALSIKLSRDLKGFKKPLFYFLNGFIFLVALYSLIEYFYINLPGIDNLILEDSFSFIIKGRMSYSTAICFSCFSLGSLLSAINPKLQKVSHYLYVTILFISFILLIHSRTLPKFETLAEFVDALSKFSPLLF